MENHGQNSVFSIGCVMCTSNFTWKDDQNIVTTCGHVYHKQCLIKWFESIQDLNPNGHYTCPDCRTVLNGENDIKPVYLHYTLPDDIQSHIVELEREKMENLQLVRQLFHSNFELKKIRLLLKSEKAKNKRLTSKNVSLEKKFAVTCQGCEGTSAGRCKIVMSKPKVKDTNLATASVGSQKLSKKLRSREYTYSL